MHACQVSTLTRQPSLATTARQIEERPMIRAFALRPAALVGAIAAAALLVACGDGAEGRLPEQSNFKPVPVSPVIGDVPIGSADAPVELVEYASLTCHVCRDFAKQTYPRLKSTYIDTGKVRYIYRDFPNEETPDGKAADGFGVVLASVARCKGPEKFHEIVDDIFTAQADLLDAAREGKALPVLAEVAAANGVSIEEMRTCIDHQPELRASIKKSRDDAALNPDPKLSFRGTPTFFLNGEKVENRGWEHLSAAIEAKLAGKPIPTTDPTAPPVESTPATTTPATPAATRPAQ
jgi:protein-disulfide isomerase